MPSAGKENIGVYCNPSHDLWVKESGPSMEEVKSGQALKEGEVTIAIKSTGICGSDIHFWRHGRIGPMIVEHDHILGHESAGEVIAVHPSVKTLQIGDRVAVEPSQICNKCEPCLTGQYNGCLEMRFMSTPPVDGLLRRYVNHSAVWCHKIGDMSYEDGAMLEPLSVSLAGMARAKIALGDPVLICGAGPIGLMTLLGCAAAGAEPIVITDIDQSRLDVAKEICPRVRTYKVQPGVSMEDAGAAISKLAGGNLKTALECSGVESSIAAAIYSVKFGGKVFVIGVGKPDINIPFMRLSTQEIDLQFQYRYANTWPRAIRLVQSGVIDMKRLVTHRFSLEDAVSAFETSAASAKTGAIKVLIQGFEFLVLRFFLVSGQKISYSEPIGYRKMSFNFLKLPVEVQHLIIAEVRCPADLKALCLVSQQISTIATEYLYRNLVIPYEDTDKEWDRLKQVLDSKGLQHVRTVTLGPSSYRDYTLITPRFLHRPVDELISRLPKHSLKSFGYGSMGRPSEEGLRNLWQRQANLTNLQLNVADRESSTEKPVHFDADTIPSLKFVTELKVDLDIESIISPCTKLSDLLASIRTQKVIVCASALTLRRLPDWEHLMERITRQMLPNSLTHINLSYTAFTTSDPLQLDDYQSLKHLEFHGCCNIDLVLDSYLRPALSTLIIELGGFEPHPERDDRDFRSVQRLLRRFSSLQKLILGAGRHWYYQVRHLEESVARHSQTLESLFLSIPGDYRYLGTVPLRCPRLSQLVIATSGTSRLEDCKIIYPMYISALPRLATLGVMRHACQAMKCHPAYIAENVFRNSPAESKLSLLAFDTIYCAIHHRLRFESYIGFDPRVLFFNDRTKDSKAVGIKASHAKYLEPESDLLDFEPMFDSCLP
ncbi:MAG: hypothetical protein LQ350_008485 [Teloschistes chrysophthalmus]|nr:MAG: hypothetical protein LQ350_008485 [Niorma chrysophthalma]